MHFSLQPSRPSTRWKGNGWKPGAPSHFPSNDMKRHWNTFPDEPMAAPGEPTRMKSGTMRLLRRWAWAQPAARAWVLARAGEWFDAGVRDHVENEALAALDLLRWQRDERSARDAVAWLKEWQA